MTVYQDLRAIQVRFSDQFSKFFDSIFNCEISNRLGDIGLIEKERPQIGPRAGTLRSGNEVVKTWSSATAYVTGDYVVSDDIIYKCISNNTNQVPPNVTYWSVPTLPIQSKGFFYTDRSGTRRHYRVFDNNLQYLNGSTWTTIKTLTSNDVEFSTQRVPVNSVAGVDSTQYAASGNATAAEKIKRDLSDPLNPNNNIGTILLITSGIYKGAYAPIIAYDGTEYTLGGSGAITAIGVGTTYKRYDTIGDVLQVARGYSDQNELYFDGISEMTWIEGYATLSLQNVAALPSGKTVKKMVSFNNYTWTFNGSTLFYTGGYPGNPLFFNYTGALTLGGNGSIIDIFQYKSRLVVIGTNFVFSVNSSLFVDRHVTTFGGIRDAYVNTGDDVYIFTTQKTLISMNETINGVVGIQNAGVDIDNYLQDFNTNLTFGFDSQKIYFYGEADSNTEGTMCVFDIKRKIWIFYTGLRPKNFISENGYLYMHDHNSDIVRYFDKDTTTDVKVGTSQTSSIEQSITLKEIDLSDIFSMKSITSLYVSFENFTQSINIDTYMAINRINGKKVRKIISVTEIPLGSVTLGEGTIGESTLGEGGMLDIISVPMLEKIAYDSSSANIWKIAISGHDGSAFYINQIDIMIGFSQPQKQYFDPTHTN